MRQKQTTPLQTSSASNGKRSPLLCGETLAAYCTGWLSITALAEPARRFPELPLALPEPPQASHRTVGFPLGILPDIHQHCSSESQTEKFSSKGSATRHARLSQAHREQDGPTDRAKVRLCQIQTTHTNYSHLLARQNRRGSPARAGLGHHYAPNRQLLARKETPSLLSVFGRARILCFQRHLRI